jgi:hypothetical protein
MEMIEENQYKLDNKKDLVVCNMGCFVCKFRIGG